jgi:hypothetical protein
MWLAANSGRAGVGSIAPEAIITRGAVIGEAAVSGSNIANIVGTGIAVFTLAVVSTAATGRGFDVQGVSS